MQMSVSIHKLIGDAINPRDNYIHDLIATPPTHFMEMDGARLIDGARLVVSLISIWKVGGFKRLCNYTL